MHEYIYDHFGDKRLNCRCDATWRMLVKTRGKHGRNEVCDAIQRVKMPAGFWKSSRKDRRSKRDFCAVTFRE